MDLILDGKSPVFGYAASAVSDDKIFAHGGLAVRSGSGSPPSDAFHVFDCAKQTWSPLTQPGSPTLSFHSAYTVEGRYLHFVGGWNGKTRSSSLYIYDARQSMWLPQCKTLNFPNGAGLSGHAIVKTADGGCLITGRLGGLQTQRRHGSVLTLKPVAFPSVFRYDNLSDALIQSRSGHTCTPIECTDQSNIIKNCILIGGRDQDIVEKLICDKVRLDRTAAAPVAVLSESDGSGKRYHRVPVRQAPSRRYHIALPIEDLQGCGKAILMHGGESFTGAAKGPSREGPSVIIMATEPGSAKKSAGANKDLNIYTLDEWETSAIRLTGHQTARIQDRVFIFGGFKEQWQRNADVHVLNL